MYTVLLFWCVGAEPANSGRSFARIVMIISQYYCIKTAVLIVKLRHYHSSDGRLHIDTVPCRHVIICWWDQHVINCLVSCSSLWCAVVCHKHHSFTDSKHHRVMSCHATELAGCVKASVISCLARWRLVVMLLIDSCLLHCSDDVSTQQILSWFVKSFNPG